MHACAGSTGLELAAGRDGKAVNSESGFYQVHPAALQHLPDLCGETLRLGHTSCDLSMHACSPAQHITRHSRLHARALQHR